MENLYLAATADSPEVDFRFDTHELTLKGESYPENAAAFYGSIIRQLHDYLASCSGVHVVLNWHYDPEDDTIGDFGSELRDDFSALEFRDLPTAS